MAVTPINFAAVLGPTTPTNSTSTGGGFGQALNAAIANLNGTQNVADNAALNFLTGQDQDPSQVTVAMQEAKVNMELAVAVRNQVVNAYKDIWQMTI